MSNLRDEIALAEAYAKKIARERKRKVCIRWIVGTSTEMLIPLFSLGHGRFYNVRLLTHEAVKEYVGRREQA